MTAEIVVVSFFSLPPEFTLFNFGTEKEVKNWYATFIGYTTEYYTSNAYSLVQDVEDACRTGAATKVIFGTIATGLAIDAYGPISDNAGGNTTAAIGKGFAIGSAALVSLALFGAYVGRAGIEFVDVLTPKAFIELIVGAILPYWFSAITMKRMGSAGLKMVEEIRQQFNMIPGLMEGRAKPDYANCVKISTDASLREMIPPGALVMLTPLIVGTLFGVKTLAVVLAGSLVSGVQVAISASNTGGAWDNSKKYIEGSECHKAEVIGDTIGNSLKGTSGPSLIKLMVVESLVFASLCAAHGGLLFKSCPLLHAYYRYNYCDNCRGISQRNCGTFE
ncbi:hypothetical protein V6N12_058366 [Hibiscus sabdariffa]|uniref:H(+)-exporting diphosphatase n=1 Tax=Hibiscus sabdariffa TaxID=183260 RepID=A0ABR2ETW4_9ROSI